MIAARREQPREIGKRHLALARPSRRDSGSVTICWHTRRDLVARAPAAGCDTVAPVASPSNSFAALRIIASNGGGKREALARSVATCCTSAVFAAAACAGLVAAMARFWLMSVRVLQQHVDGPCARRRPRARTWKALNCASMLAPGASRPAAEEPLWASARLPLGELRRKVRGQIDGRHGSPQLARGARRPRLRRRPRRPARRPHRPWLPGRPAARG